MSNELISVIVPVYNVAPYIEKCCSSILEQDYKNIELLLIDDGSPDNCSELCDKIAENDSRVRVIHQKNAGVSAARNRGICEATGFYVCFVDGDDYIDRDMLTYLVRILETTGSDLARCASRAVGENVPKQEEYADNAYEIYTPKDALKYIYLAEKGFSATSCHLLYKKNIIEDIRFGTAKYYEDMEYITKVVLNCSKVVSSRASKYNYLHRDDSSHSYPFAQRMGNIELVCEDVKEQLKGNFDDLIRYVDIRYVKNALDELNRESLAKGIRGNTDAKRAIKKIKERKVSFAELNKTEKMLYMSLGFGDIGFDILARMVKVLKNGR